MIEWGDKGALIFSLDDYHLTDDNFVKVKEYDFEHIRSNEHSLYNNACEDRPSDFPGKETVMFLFGRTQLGWSVAVRATVFPRVTLELPVQDSTGRMINWNAENIKTVEQQLRRDIVIGRGGSMARTWMQNFCATAFVTELKYQHVLHGFHPTGVVSTDREEALRTFPFLKVYFPSRSAQREAIKLFRIDKQYNDWTCTLAGGRRVHVQMAERGFNDILNLLLDVGVSPGKFCALRPGSWQPVLSGHATHCDIEVTCTLEPYRDTPCVFVPVEYLGTTFKRVLSYDIECAPADTKLFPDARKLNDGLFCIASAVQVAPGVPWRKAVHAMPNSGADQVENKSVLAALLAQMKNKDGSVSDPGPDLAMEYSGVHAADELDLVEKWADWVIAQDVDIRTGYNISGFDEAYIADRVVLQCLIQRQGYEFSDVQKLFASENDRKPWDPLANVTDRTRALHCSKLIFFKSELARTKFQSKAHGNASYAKINTPGTVVLDLLDYVRKEFKLREYGLDFVAHHFVNSNKLGMNIQEMFARIKHGGAEACLPVLLYCMKDADLPLQIMEEIMLLSKAMEMCAITNVMSRDMFARGQLWRVTSDVSRFAYQMRTSMNVAPPNKTFIPTYHDDMSFKGGLVMEPVKGLHINFVGVLDFRSLYPSIIIANNLCNSTLLKPAQVVPEGFVTQTWTTDVGTFTFQQDPIIGIQPRVCQAKLEQRDQAKNDMQKERRAGNKSRALMQDSRQLAIKVSTNSVYGFSGTSENMNANSNLAIAATVTYIGRQLIQATMDIAVSIKPASDEAPFTAEVIYSDTDSIFVKLHGIAPRKSNYALARKIFARMAQHITDEFARRSIRTDPIGRNAIVLQFEAIYWPLTMLAKKRYMCLAWEHADQLVGSSKAKGIMDARRDSIVFNVKVSKLCKAEINSMNDDESDDTPIETRIAAKVRKIYEIIRREFGRLVNNEVPLDEIIITRSLGSVYAMNTVIQDVVARKMNARDPATRPRSGDRVRILVYFDPDMHHDNTPLCERVDDPVYLQKKFAEKGNRMCVDAMYVLTQFESAYTDILANVDPAGENSLKRVFEGLRDLIRAKRSGAVSFAQIEARKRKNADKTHEPVIVMSKSATNESYAVLRARMLENRRNITAKKNAIESIIKKPCRTKH